MKSRAMENHLSFLLTIAVADVAVAPRNRSPSRRTTTTTTTKTVFVVAGAPPSPTYRKCRCRRSQSTTLNYYSRHWLSGEARLLIHEGGREREGTHGAAAVHLLCRVEVTFHERGGPCGQHSVSIYSQTSLRTRMVVMAVGFIIPKMPSLLMTDG